MSYNECAMKYFRFKLDTVLYLPPIANHLVASAEDNWVLLHLMGEYFHYG